MVMVIQSLKSVMMDRNLMLDNIQNSIWWAGDLLLSGFRDQPSHSKKKKLCDLIVYTNGSITKDKSAVHCRARPSLKMVLPLRHQSPAWQWNWKQLHMLSAGSPQKVKASPTCHHPHRSGEPATHWKVEWDDQASTWQCFVAILSIMEPRVG